MGFFNAFVKLLLRSPLHGLMGNVMLITVSGRRSGRLITTPVQFVRDGEDLLVTSDRRRRWWRNLRGGAPVTVRLKGSDLSGRAEAAADDKGAVAEGIAAYLRAAPAAARWFKIALDSEGRPDPADLARVAEERMVTRIRLDPGVR